MSQKIPPFRQMIVYEDDRFVVISKPAGIASLEDRKDPENIHRMAKKYLENLQLCHRLDKETSGALLLAKDPDTYRWMAIRFENREVEKTYHAIVDGLHNFKDEKVDIPVEALPNGEARAGTRKGKKSLTVFNSLAAYKNHTLVECRPVTGRLHQIRIHLAWLNAPVTGDIQYGGKPFYLSSVKRNYTLGKFEEERPLIGRFALHAFSLSFEAGDHTVIRVEAPYPKDFRVLVSQLEKNT